MILRKIVYLRKSITYDRLSMYEIAKGKKLSHSDVLKISEQLDEKIAKLQKLIFNINKLA